MYCYFIYPPNLHHRLWNILSSVPNIHTCKCLPHRKHSKKSRATEVRDKNLKPKIQFPVEKLYLTQIVSLLPELVCSLCSAGTALVHFVSYLIFLCTNNLIHVTNVLKRREKLLKGRFTEVLVPTYPVLNVRNNMLAVLSFSILVLVHSRSLTR